MTTPAGEPWQVEVMHIHPVLFDALASAAHRGPRAARRRRRARINRRGW